VLDGTIPAALAGEQGFFQGIFEYPFHQPGLVAFFQKVCQTSIDRRQPSSFIKKQIMGSPEKAMGILICKFFLYPAG